MLFAHWDTATAVSLIVSVVIPLAAAGLKWRSLPPALVGVLTLVLSVANGFFTEWAAAGSAFRWQPALNLALSSLIVAVVAHRGQWKGTAIEARLLAFPTAKTAAPAAPAAPPAAPPA